MTTTSLPARPRRIDAAATIAAASLLLAACSQRSDKATTSGARGSLRATPAEALATGVSTGEARFVMNIVGLQGPESVRYDREQDVYFVSNMTGYGSVKDGNGYISRISASHPNDASVFAEGGKGGVALDAPKGMAIHGDTLWVADINVLRGFERHTGAPLANIDFTPQGVVMLNDVAVGPDGTLRVTDTGILMSPKGVIHVGPDRIFAVGPGGAITVVGEGPQLLRPNGITWDSAGARWVVVSFDPFKGDVATWKQGDSARRVIRTGKGKLDGVEVLHDGTILFASWADSSVHALRDGRDEQVVREVPEPADIGVDTRRNRLLIPLSTLGRVQLWDLGTLGRGAPAPQAVARR